MNINKKIKKYVEWHQILEGATLIKWWRRPIVKIKYNYWKLRNALLSKK